MSDAPKLLDHADVYALAIQELAAPSARYVVGVDMAAGPSRDAVLTMLRRKGDHVVILDHQTAPRPDWVAEVARWTHERLIVGPDWLQMLTPCSGAAPNGCPLTRAPLPWRTR